MLENIIKDLEKYARWQDFFSSYVCVLSVGMEAMTVNGWLEGTWKREEEEQIKRKETRGLNIIKVFYIHAQKHQNETFCFVSTHANTDLLFFEIII